VAKAAATASSEADLTRGGFVGTPAFASPEQFASVGVDIRSDPLLAGRRALGDANRSAAIQGLSG
jgi:hypothetical protein